MCRHARFAPCNNFGEVLDDAADLWKTLGQRNHSQSLRTTNIDHCRAVAANSVPWIVLNRLGVLHTRLLIEEGHTVRETTCTLLIVFDGLKVGFVGSMGQVGTL